MGNKQSSGAAPAHWSDGRIETSGDAHLWKAKPPNQATRLVLQCYRRLTMAKMLHARLGDGALWLESEIIEQVIRYIPPHCMVLRVPAECATIG
jgi:hypothetical protein